MAISDNERLLLHHFSQYITDHKKNLIQSVLDRRTRHVTVVLEDIFQPQNASAAVRTCECMGLQDVHIVENTIKYQVNRDVLKGSHKWLNLIRYNKKEGNNTDRCFAALREQGYTIYATGPSPDGISVHDIDPLQKSAIVFGNEHFGVSDYALKQCDAKVQIPMYGFTESLNISVSVAIAVNILITKLRQFEWRFGLSAEEKEELMLKWYRKIVRRSDLIEREFMRSIQ